MARFSKVLKSKNSELPTSNFVGRDSLTYRSKVGNKGLRDRVEQLQNQLLTLQAYAFSLDKSPPVQGSWREVVWAFEDLVLRGPLSAIRRNRAFQVLKLSGLFDANFYSEQSALKVTPPRLLRHYIANGFNSNFDPCPGFNVAKYFDFYPDIKSSGLEPLSHYLCSGRAENRIVLPSDRASVAFGPISGQSDNLEARPAFPWGAASNSMQLGQFDVRPDDAVPIEGRVGDAFLGRHNLLSEAPNFGSAVDELNLLFEKNCKAESVSEKIEVSIVVPVFGQLAYTLNCLHSLINHKSKYKFEIIVCDDYSQDETESWLNLVGGIIYKRRAKNEGFIINCNFGADVAVGEYLIMLNNDTRVVSGWLDGLLDGFDIWPNAGLIGSKLFYPDGTLQEAGGIVWQDGSAWNYGRGDDPNRPRYSYARKIDYVSGCSIALRTDIWRAMGGFDTYFSPAYCEDVDLCFRLREAGYETWYQPSSRIIHYEGKTSGTDIASGIKAYQVANTEKLRERWSQVLQGHRPNADKPWLERDRGISRRVLVIDAENPTPWKDAGSIAIINLFKYYQANGYQVSFAPENFLFEARAVSEMQRIGVQVFYAPYETNLQNLLRSYGHLFDVIHVVRADVAYKSLELIKRFVPHAMTIFQNCDLHYLRMERQAVVEDNKALLKEAESMKERELQLSREFDLTITHSHAEKAILDNELSGEKILVMPLVEAVVESSAIINERKDFIFLGGYGHPPNVDAAHWILDEIWPGLSARFPAASLLFVGANPPSSIMSRSSDRIIVTGLVDDLAPWFDRSRVFLAALRYGAGAKGKVLASLAHGVPVVATQVAAEGLPLVNGKSVFIAESATEIIDEAARLYSMQAAGWRTASKCGQAYIRKNHSFETGVRLLNQALAES